MPKKRRGKYGEKEFNELLEANWMNLFAALKAFKKKYGNVLVGIEYKKSHPVLYRWVKRQREFKAEGKINPVREERLDKINFIWNVKDHIWDKFYDQAKAYYEKHHNINMTEAFKRKNRQFSTWISHQREYKMHNKHLTPEKIIKLDAIGFDKRNYRESWNDNYELLKQFYKKHGHFDTRSDKNLNRWIIMQRNKTKQNRMLPGHFTKLKKAGFPFKGITGRPAKKHNLQLL